MRAGIVLLVCATVAAAGCVGPRLVGSQPVEPPQVRNISFTNLPSSGAPGATIILCWRMDGNGTIPETGIRTDNVHPEVADHVDFAGPTYYPDNASIPVPVTLPNTVCTAVKLPASGSLYVEAYGNSASGNSSTMTGLSTIPVGAGDQLIPSNGPGCGLQLLLNRTEIAPGETVSIRVHFRACEDGIATNMPVLCGNEGPFVQLAQTSWRYLPLWRSDAPWPEGAHSCPARIAGAPPFGAINVTRGEELEWNFSWRGEWRWTQDGPILPAPAGNTTIAVVEQNATATATVRVLPSIPCLPLLLSTPQDAVYVGSTATIEVTYTACRDETVDPGYDGAAPTTLIEGVNVTLALKPPMASTSTTPAPFGPLHVPQGESRTYDYLWNGTWERDPNVGLEDVPAGTYRLTTTYGPYVASTNLTWLGQT